MEARARAWARAWTRAWEGTTRTRRARHPSPLAARHRSRLAVSPSLFSMAHRPRYYGRAPARLWPHPRPLLWQVADAYFRAGADKISIGSDAVDAARACIEGGPSGDSSIEAISK
eukprot:1141856-Prymnesium_polylepis.1